MVAAVVFSGAKVQTLVLQLLLPVTEGGTCVCDYLYALSYLIASQFFGFAQLDKDTHGALFVVGAALLRPLVAEWGCSTEELCEFLHVLQFQYQENPYHNQTHAAMVGYEAWPSAKQTDAYRIVSSH